MIGENVGCIGASGPAGFDHDPFERVHGEPLPFVERSEVQAERAGTLDLVPKIVDERLDQLRRRHPVAQHGLGAFAGQPLELARFNPSALGDHALRAGVGLGDRGSQLRVGIEDGAAADGLSPAEVPQHEAVAHDERQRDGQVQPGVAGLAGGDAFGPEHAQPHRPFARSEIQGVGAPAGHIAAEAVQHRELHVDAAGVVPLVAPHQGDASSEIVGVDTGEIERDTVTRVDPLDGRALGLDRSHPCCPASRRRPQLVAGRDAAASERAGHDSPGAGRGERPVDPQSGPVAVGCGGRGSAEVIEGSPQLVQTGAVDGVGGDHRRVLEECALDMLGNIQPGQLGKFGVDETNLAEHDHAVGDAQQVQDRQVLGRLRLPALWCRDDEQGGVHRPDSGQHVLHESDVPGHVDEADLPA